MGNTSANNTNMLLLCLNYQPELCDLVWSSIQTLDSLMLFLQVLEHRLVQLLAALNPPLAKFSLSSSYLSSLKVGKFRLVSCYTKKKLVEGLPAYNHILRCASSALPCLAEALALCYKPQRFSCIIMRPWNQIDVLTTKSMISSSIITPCESQLSVSMKS